MIESTRITKRAFLTGSASTFVTFAAPNITLADITKEKLYKILGMLEDMSYNIDTTILPIMANLYDAGLISSAYYDVFAKVYGEYADADTNIKRAMKGGDYSKVQMKDICKYDIATKVNEIMFVTFDAVRNLSGQQLIPGFVDEKGHPLTINKYKTAAIDILNNNINRWRQLCN